MHTRFQASRRSSRATRGSTDGSDLGSMLTRTSGHRRRNSSRRGTRIPRPRNGKLLPPSGENVKPASAASTSAIPSSAIVPVRSVTRSRRSSWNATSTPSRVRWASVSRYLYPSATATSNAASVFSGASPAPPRWAARDRPRVVEERVHPLHHVQRSQPEWFPASSLRRTALVPLPTRSMAAWLAVALISICTTSCWGSDEAREQGELIKATIDPRFLLRARRALFPLPIVDRTKVVDADDLFPPLRRRHRDRVRGPARGAHRRRRRGGVRVAHRRAAGVRGGRRRVQCARVDSNHPRRNLSTRPSTLRVYQFRHRRRGGEYRPPGSRRRSPRRWPRPCIRPPAALQCEHMFVSGHSPPEPGVHQTWI